jgi:predicted DNA-binding transcriptional regulator AlpA
MRAELPDQSPRPLPGHSGASSTNNSTPDPLLIKAPAAQALLCMGKTRLWTLSRCGAIPSRKIGNSLRYSPAELAAWVAAGCPTEPGAWARLRRKGATR